MNATERRALSKIIDQRFKALQHELDTRREQIEQDIRDRLIAESERSCKAAQRRMEKLTNRARTLEEQVQSEQAAIADSLGVIPGEVSTYREWVKDGKDGKTRQVIKTHPCKPVTLIIANTWAPIDLEARIASEIGRLTTEHAQGGRSLDSLRLDLQEKLLLGDVQSDEAKAFLARIPSVDSLLPMPTEPPKLTAGAR